MRLPVIETTRTLLRNNSTNWQARPTVPLKGKQRACMSCGDRIRRRPAARVAPTIRLAEVLDLESVQSGFLRLLDGDGDPVLRGRAERNMVVADQLHGECVPAGGNARPGVGSLRYGAVGARGGGRVRRWERHGVEVEVDVTLSGHGWWNGGRTCWPTTLKPFTETDNVTSPLRAVEPPVGVRMVIDGLDVAGTLAGAVSRPRGLGAP